MSPELAATLGAGGAVVALLIVVLIVDQFFGPLPTFRRHRNKALAGLAVVCTLGLILLVWRKPKPDEEDDDLTPVEPKDYDNADAIENKKNALDTDVDAAGDAAGKPTLKELQSELDGL